MAGGTWTPIEALLGAVRENESFSYTIQYYEIELVGDVETQVQRVVNLTQLSPKNTVSVQNGLAAAISGFYETSFFDTIVYLDFSNTIKTLDGDISSSAWEKFDINDCYQFVEFIPDNTRYRRFEFQADAVSESGAIIESKTYYVDLSDLNWTPGMLALQEAVSIIKGRGD